DPARVREARGQMRERSRHAGCRRRIRRWWLIDLPARGDQEQHGNSHPARDCEAGTNANPSTVAWLRRGGDACGATAYSRSVGSPTRALQHATDHRDAAMAVGAFAGRAQIDDAARTIGTGAIEHVAAVGDGLAAEVGGAADRNRFLLANL